MGGQKSGSLWVELGSTMRRARDDAGVSLRQLESRGSWRRSTLSQVENARARPSLELVQWFDSELGTDGLLQSIYAAARTCQLRDDPPDGQDTDAPQVLDVDPASGQLVNPDDRLQARFTLANAGGRRWSRRRLRRMGAYTGLRLIGSSPDVPVPDVRPGDACDVVVDLRAPERTGTAVAYWTLVDTEGAETAPSAPPLAVSLVVV